MKPTSFLFAVLILGSTNCTLSLRVDAQVLPGPALMNFQGRLARPDGTAVADGDYSIQFSLWNAVAAGNQKWTQALPTVSVANGVFDVLLDVGAAGLFNGDLWLEIQIGTDVPLSPRQQLVPAAYAMKANTVPDGSIGATQITAGSIPADKLVAGTLNPVAWQLTGNSGAASKSGFLGTIDNQPLIFRTSNAERLRIEQDGRVGIGTATPTARLDVNGDVKAANFVGSGAALTALPPIAALLNANQTFTGVNNFNQGVAVNGTATVGYLAVNPQIPGGSEGGEILLRGAGGANNPDWTIDSFSSHFRFVTGAGVKLDLDSAGNATVTGNIAATSATIPALNGNVSINGTAAVGYLAVNPQVPGGSEGGEILLRGAGGANNPDWVIDNQLGQVRLFTGGVVKFRVDSSGNATVAGNISASSATIPTLNGNVSVNGEMTAKVVTITGGSDVAEPYHVANAGDVKPIPGMVVGIDPDQVGRMRVSARAYDKTVAGILSGANGIAPGITLRQAGTVADGALPVASIGRVWCFCDAGVNGPIEAGDLLTTSDTAGHAMKVIDFDRANGSVIGKAMSKLKSGRGLVLVLVSLK